MDWNYRLTSILVDDFGRTLRGCVDWNRTLHSLLCYNVAVAPFAGAWIEMLVAIYIKRITRCRTLRGCVDWNNSTMIHKIRGVLSHPSRVRGLKLLNTFWKLVIVKSHPSRVRGLKYKKYEKNLFKYKVAPFAGAWIEIKSVFTFDVTDVISRTLRGCVDWNHTIHLARVSN